MSLGIFHNGSVWINQSQTSNAIAIKDGLVFAHGQTATELISKADFVVDLRGCSLTPGFGDGHAHPMNGGVEKLFTPISDAKNISEIKNAVKKFATENPELKIIRGEGYDPALAPDGIFDAYWLDDVVSDRPVVLRALDYHTVWLNSAALKLAGISASSPDPHLGEIVRRESGEPIGTLREWGAWNLIYEKLEKLTEKQMEFAANYATNYFSKHGVTWVQDAWVDDSTYEMWLIAASNGILKQRVNFAWLANPLDNWKFEFSKWHENKKYLNTQFHNLLTGNSVKIFVDGILEGGTAALLDSYCNCQSKGISNWNEKELEEVISFTIQEGFQPHIHAIGDAGIRSALNALEIANLKFKTINNAVIAHCQLINPSDKPRFKELGITANFEPLWAQLSEEQLSLTIPRIGQERANLQYPIASMIALGGNISFGSDWPVTSGNPIEGIQVAITRQTENGDPKGGWIPSEKISLNQALHLYTCGVAVQAGQSASWGTLDIGKSADLVVFDQNLFELDPKELNSAVVLGTWLGGVQVYG